MSDTDSNKGRGSPESVAHSAAADQQATEIEQLKKRLEAANLQIRDKDNQLAAADADHHNLQEQVEAALQDRDRQLAEAAQATDNARRVLQELNQTQQQLQHRSRREILSAFCRKEHRSGSSSVLHLHLLSVLCQISDQWTLINCSTGSG